MKLQAAGMTDAKRQAWMYPGSPSVRPATQGITCTGTSWMCATRCRTESSRRSFCDGFGFASAAARYRLAALAPQLADRSALRRVGHDDEVPLLLVAARRSLLREAKAFLEHLAFDRAREIEPASDGARGRKELVRRQVRVTTRGPRHARGAYRPCHR